MTKEEYITRLEQIKRKCQKEVNELGLEYAKSNNPYQVGDTIKDHAGAMVIERVQLVLSAFVQISYNIPVCRYYGVQLKKDGTPKKASRPNVFNLSIKHNKSKMTKEEYLSKVASVRREMCEQIIAITSEYIRESPGKVDELDADGIRLMRFNASRPIKGGKELTLVFSAILEATFPNA